MHMPRRNSDESWGDPDDTTEESTAEKEFFDRDWPELKTGLDWPLSAPPVDISEQNALTNPILERETSHTYAFVAERTKPTSRPPEKPPESSAKFPRATLDLDGFILAGYYDKKTINGFLLAYETASQKGWPIKVIDGIDADGHKRKEIYIKPPLSFIFHVGTIHKQIQQTLKGL